MLQINRPPVCAQAGLRKPRNLLCHLFGGVPGLAVRHHFFAEADPQALLGVNFPPRHNDFEGTPLAGETRKPDGTAIR
jgi:hypothetical protein